MKKHSRRQFLESFGAAIGLVLAGGGCGALCASFSPKTADDFNFLVVGDSLAWGQGLREEDKFYTLTKNWLERDVFRGARPVNLNVKAHSGATIKLSDKESAALRRAGKNEADSYPPEITLSFPTIWAQIDAAGREYENVRSRLDLVMLTGGITEITVTEILNPFKDNEKLRRDVRRYCRDSMFELLDHAARTFPNSVIAVVGYYPIITRRTPMKKLVGDILEIYDAPGWLKFLLNNPLKRQILKGFRRRIIRRSEIWAEASAIELQTAVAALNRKFEAARAVFIKPPFGEENAYGAKETLLWKIAERGAAGDDVYAERRADCRAALADLNEVDELKYQTRKCELASVGHPNTEGARLIARAVAENLKPFFQLAERVE